MTKTKPHVHADIIKAWADGAIIERAVYGELSGELLRWEEQKHPYWIEDAVYRVKPETKPDIIRYVPVSSKVSSEFSYASVNDLYKWLLDLEDTPMSVLKVTFCGNNPSILKSVEKVK